MRILSRIAALAVSGIVIAAGTAVPAQALQSAAMPPEGSRDSVLFSVISDESTVDMDGKSLTITVPADSDLVWFTDRPARRAGQGTLPGLIKQWKAFGFDKIPPNAVIVTSKSGKAMQYPVTLKKPRMAGDRATFTAVRLANDDFPVAGMTGEKGPKLTTGAYAATQLFIDTGSIQYCGGLTYTWSQGPVTVYVTTVSGTYAFPTNQAARGLADLGLAWVNNMVVCGS